MLIKRPDDIKAHEITDPAVFAKRRQILAASAGAALLLAGPRITWSASERLVPNKNLTEHHNKVYSLNEEGKLYKNDEFTPHKDITTYNNYYEFGTAKGDPARHAHQLTTRPWQIEVAGECGKPGTYDLEDFIAPHKLEERVYRLRCVEAWSMVIPWLGVPVADVLKRFEPNSHAKYVSFTTALRPDEMPGTRRKVLNWPYVEGLRLDEAMNPLSFFVVGLYGRILPNQNGAPIRLISPWKYGFKGIKSIVRVEFTRMQPPTSWNDSAPQEYGFYSNVNPDVDHPRWSQAKERRIGEFFKRKTLMYNGYGEHVAHMYSGMDLMKYY